MLLEKGKALALLNCLNVQNCSLLRKLFQGCRLLLINLQSDNRQGQIMIVGSFSIGTVSSKPIDLVKMIYIDLIKK